MEFSKKEEKIIANDSIAGTILKDFVKEGDLIEMANGKRGPDRYTESRVTLWELNPKEYEPVDRIINTYENVIYVVSVRAYDSGRVYLTKVMNEAVDFTKSLSIVPAIESFAIIFSSFLLNSIAKPLIELSILTSV
jgi:hypothetical protein